MRYDLHFRTGIKEQLSALANKMSQWESQPRIEKQEEDRITDAIQTFDHTTLRENLIISGVDGSGDYPSISYGDSFIYIAFAQGVTYQSVPLSGLREIGPEQPPVIEFIWLPEEEEHRLQALDEAFALLAGAELKAVIQDSDYRHLKTKISKKKETVQELMAGLIRPHAADSGNLAIQFRSTAEAGTALRLLGTDTSPKYLLVDGTLSLPFVGRVGLSLFHEHLKRLCCVKARQEGTGFFALSKSHGLPAIELIEDLARTNCEMEKGQVAEHWFLRLPVPGFDQWKLTLTEGRMIPPIGAVSYLVRFHRTTPVFRLDMDRKYWESNVRSDSTAQMIANEKSIFEDLDYASHDQRSYGYPYPIKAGHDRASLTNAEREVLRKQIIDAAVKAGMRRSLFRNISIATGHQ